MKGLCVIAMVLTVVGGINWGLVGLGMLLGGKNLNFVNLLLGSIPTLEAVVYILVGVSALWVGYGHMAKKCVCKA
jgi:uncharacterized membrane protein YuzA (DUF378 family)